MIIDFKFHEAVLCRTNVKRVMMMAAAVMCALTVAAQDVNAEQEDVMPRIAIGCSTTMTLPVSISNKKDWDVTETTIRLNSEGEEQLAYELVGFRRIDGTQRSGSVFYVPGGVDDRIILVLQDVRMTNERVPAVIDNLSNRQLIIHTIGATTLRNEGTIIRSQGGLTIIGQETDSLTEANRLTITSTGRNRRAAIEAVGDVSLFNLDIDMAANRGIYAIRSIPDGEEQPVLILNNVQGTVNGQQGAVHGFKDIEGTRCTLDGVELTIDNEE